MKCNKCKEEIETPEINMVKDGSYYFHDECLILKLKNKKNQTMTDSEIKDYVSEKREETIKKYLLQKSKDELYYFVSEKYKIAKMSSRYFGNVQALIDMGFDLTIVLKMLHNEKFDNGLINAHKKRMLVHKEELDGESKWNYDLILIQKYYNKFLKYLETLKQSEKIVDYAKAEREILKKIKEEQEKTRKQGFKNRYEEYLFED